MDRNSLDFIGEMGAHYMTFTILPDADYVGDAFLL